MIWSRKNPRRTTADDEMRSRIDQRARDAEAMLRAVRARTAVIRELSEEATRRLERNGFGADLTESMRRR